MKATLPSLLCMSIMLPSLNAMNKTMVLHPQLKRAAVAQLFYDFDNEPQMHFEALGFDPCSFRKDFHRIRIKNNRLRKLGSFKSPHTSKKRNSPSQEAYKAQQ